MRHGIPDFLWQIGTGVENLIQRHNALEHWRDHIQSWAAEDTSPIDLVRILYSSSLDAKYTLLAAIHDVCFEPNQVPHIAPWPDDAPFEAMKESISYIVLKLKLLPNSNTGARGLDTSEFARLKVILDDVARSLLTDNLRRANDCAVDCVERANGILVAISFFATHTSSDVQANARLTDVQRNVAELLDHLGDLFRLLHDPATVEPFRQSRFELRNESPSWLQGHRSAHEAVLSLAEHVAQTAHNATLATGSAVERWRAVVVSIQQLPALDVLTVLDNEYRHVLDGISQEKNKRGSETPEPRNMVNKCKILFLAANPEGTSQLTLNEESREIEYKIRAAKYRDSLELITKWAVRPDDLLQYLNQFKPQVVHFSGHGSEAEEIMLMDADRRPMPVSKHAMKQLFLTLKDNIRVVVLNACYSQAQAEAIIEVIDCAIGMKRAIGDKAAIVFSASFYRAVGFGDSVYKAFEQGRTALMLEGISEEDTPILLMRSGIDPKTLFLVTHNGTASST